MHILLLDESTQAQKNQESHFVLLGAIVHSDNLIPLERELANIAKKHNLQNLKELRTRFDISRKDKVKISKEVYSCLSFFSVTLVSSIIGTYSMKNVSRTENYRTALEFIMERFFFYLHNQDSKGIVILDSNIKTITKPIRKNMFEFILTTEKREGKLRNRIYGPVFFCEDEYSHIIQLSDLCVAGLQRGSWELLKSLPNSGHFKGKEDQLCLHNEFLNMYWPHFMRYKGKVAGSGIKYWN